MGIFAWGTLATFVAIGVLSVLMLVQSLGKAAEPDPVVYFSARRNLLFSSVAILGSILATCWAISSRQYYVIFVPALVISYLVPVPVIYFRTRKALIRAGKLPRAR